MKDEQKILDLSSKSFEQFVAFFFNRDAVPDEKQFAYFLTDLEGEPYDEAVHSSPSLVVEHLTKLFSEFGLIAPKYSLPQLDQGIWGLWGENLRLYELLWTLPCRWINAFSASGQCSLFIQILCPNPQSR